MGSKIEAAEKVVGEFLNTSSITVFEIESQDRPMNIQRARRGSIRVKQVHEREFDPDIGNEGSVTGIDGDAFFQQLQFSSKTRLSAKKLGNDQITRKYPGRTT